MAVDTFSIFYYGYEITKENQNLNFSEGGGELTAVIDIGPHTLSELLVKMKTALDAAGALTYTVTADRSTRKITIAASGTFEILVSSGSQIGTGPFSVLGFTGADRTGAATYEGDSVSGDFYAPQFKLQDYVASTDFQEKVQPSINESASGKVETISFGTREFIVMSIKYINDYALNADVIKDNATGIADARRFFQEITRKVPFEFMEDISTPSTFEKVIVETMPGNNRGTGYRMVELVGNGLKGFFEINTIKLRVVN